MAFRRIEQRTHEEKTKRRGALGFTCMVAASPAEQAASGTDDGAEEPFVWTETAECPLARFEANGVVIGDELWVMGGFTSSSLAVTRQIDIYDPEANTWRRGPDLPGAETHIAVVTLGDDIIVAGGFVGAFERGGVRAPTTDAVWRWNAQGEEWTAEAALPTSGAAFSWALLGTELHLAGGLAADGNTDSDVHYVRDGAEAAPWSTSEPLPNARNHGGGAAAGGSFYAIAGRHNWDENAGAVTDVHAFDPASGTWSPRAPLPSARSEIGASTRELAGGKILVIGGSLPGIMPSDDVFVYDPTADAWSSLPRLPGKRKGAVAAQLGRRIVVTTGSPTSTDPSATTWIGCCL